MRLIRQVGKAVFAGADVFLPSPQGPRILIYHQVGSRLGRQMEVTVGDFIWQLDWLAQNREVVSLDTALQRWDEPGSENLVVLSFDDGYRDTYSTAYPLMKERGMPFTLYLATEKVETGDGLIGAEPLTWDQIEEMVASGLVTIGSHTHTHADLRTLAADGIIREIETNNRLLESRLESSPVHFAYPWGYWSEPADHVVRSTYVSAVLGAPSLFRTTRFDPYFLHRFPVQLADGRSWFTRRLHGGLLMEEEARRLLRRYRLPRW